MKTKFFLCTTCGNVVFKFVDSGVDLVCCGQSMRELIPSTNDSSASEKHVPVVEFKDNGEIMVKVGSQRHPMTESHHIAFIYLETEKGGQARYLAPGEEPEAVFFDCKDKPVAVYEYCNIHGLWKKDLT